MAGRLPQIPPAVDLAGFGNHEIYYRLAYAPARDDPESGSIVEPVWSHVPAQGDGSIRFTCLLSRGGAGGKAVGCVDIPLLRTRVRDVTDPLEFEFRSGDFAGAKLFSLDHANLHRRIAGHRARAIRRGGSVNLVKGKALSGYFPFPGAFWCYFERFRLYF
jgi:hypothetical protein